MIGLTRALLYAGAASVLVSLWRVDELSTGLLLARFYSELQPVPRRPSRCAAPRAGCTGCGSPTSPATPGRSDRARCYGPGWRIPLASDVTAGSLAGQRPNNIDYGAPVTQPRVQGIGVKVHARAGRGGCAGGPAREKRFTVCSGYPHARLFAGERRPWRHVRG
ncbi:CHAT domain-containing protein [Streptomyces sp. NBC_00151]|uniref:CHAT domain-containing protein n=1 Tax=Streptomyces sp. NBC_00151 TaxID=2975669 RepID=UPI003FA356FC